MTRDPLYTDDTPTVFTRHASNEHLLLRVRFKLFKLCVIFFFPFPPSTQSRFLAYENAHDIKQRSGVYSNPASSQSNQKTQQLEIKYKSVINLAIDDGQHLDATFRHCQLRL